MKLIEARLAAWVENSDMWQEACLANDAQLAVLVAALEKYGQHGTDPNNQDPNHNACCAYLGDDYPCVCGLRTVLRRARYAS